MHAAKTYSLVAVSATHAETIQMSLVVWRNGLVVPWVCWGGTDLVEHLVTDVRLVQ